MITIGWLQGQDIRQKEQVGGYCTLSGVKEA